MRNIILPGNGTPQRVVRALFAAYGIYSALTEGVEKALVAVLLMGRVWNLPPAFRTLLFVSAMVVYQKS